jgi:hypothetical protein
MTYYYCVIIDCAIERPITYDINNTITNATVDYCFENLNDLRKFIGARWFNGTFTTDLSFSDSIKRDKHIKDIIGEMNKENNKLIKSDKLSDNDSCCHYMVFKTTDINVIKDFDMVIKRTKEMFLKKE